GEGRERDAVAPALVEVPCLDPAQAVALARLAMAAEDLLGPVEVEWALDDDGFQILQSRPLRVAPVRAPDALWLRHRALRGQPAGIGWGSGKACIGLTEHDLDRVGTGHVLRTRGPVRGVRRVLPPRAPVR